MTIDILTTIVAYILFGIFLASAIDHFGDGDLSPALFNAVLFLWPLIIAVLIIIAVVCIPYMLGKMTAQFLYDLMRR